MKNTLAIFWSIAWLLAGGAALAEETVLSCTYEYTHNIDDPSKSGATTGGFVVTFSEEHSKLISLGVDYLGLCNKLELLNFSKFSFSFTCTNQGLEEPLNRVVQIFSVSRVTGKFELIHAYKPGNGLLHTGTCAPSTQKF